MAEKQTIMGRIAQLAKANINALLDKAEDPQKMIDQLVRDYTNSIIEAENAIAQTLGNLRMAEKDYEEDVKAAADWGQKAAAASAKADALRAAGDEAGATKWDDLAKVALGKQIQFENEIKTEEPSLQAQREVAERLKRGLSQMKDKLTELKSRRDQLIAREKTAGDRRARLHQHPGPHERARPFRGPCAPPGGPGAGQDRAGRLLPGRAVRGARNRLLTDRDRGSPGGPEGQVRGVTPSSPWRGRDAAWWFQWGHPAGSYLASG